MGVRNENFNSTKNRTRDLRDRRGVYAVPAWKNRYWGVASRIYYTVVTLTAAAFVWFLNQWNLLGWRY